MLLKEFLEKLSACFIFSFFCLLFICTGSKELHASPSSYGSNSSFPSLEPVYEFPFSVMFELSDEEIIQMGLEFSMCHTDSAAFEDCMDLYRNLRDEISSSLSGETDEAKAEKILLLMYEKLLVQYSEEQTQIDVLLKDGTYNCVSASVLYMALARSAGLKVSGVRTSSHAFCTVNAGGKSIDVECTNPLGFDPGSRKMTDGNGSYYIVPAGKYNGRSTVSDRMFVSLVCKNIVSLYNDYGRYDVALPYAVTRMVFLKDSPLKEYQDARGDFDSICGNVSASYQKKYAYVDAMLFLDQVYRRWGASEALQDNMDAAIYNSVLFMCDCGDLDTAQSIFSEHKPYLGSEMADKAEYLIFSRKMDEALGDLKGRSAVDFIHKYEKSCNVGNALIASRLFALLEYNWSVEIDGTIRSGLSKNQDAQWLVYEEGLELCGEALADCASSSQIVRMKEQCVYNYSVCIHNRFVDLYNGGSYDEAMSVLDEGLSVCPESKILKEDKKSFIKSL